MKNILKLVAVMSVAFALAGCERDWANVPMYEGKFDAEMSAYMNENLPPIKVPKGEKLYFDAHVMDHSPNATVYRAFVDGELRYLETIGKGGNIKGLSCDPAFLSGAIIEYSDAEGYKVQPGDGCWSTEDMASFIRGGLINSSMIVREKPYIRVSRIGY